MIRNDEVPAISFPSKLEMLRTNATITADNQLPPSLTELHAFNVLNDVDMKALPLLKTISIRSKSFDINRCTDKVTDIGMIENDRLHLLKTDRKFTSLCVVSSHCGMPAIASKYKDLETLFAYCDSDGACANDECTRNHEIVLDFSSLTKLTRLRYSQGVNNHYDEFTTIPLKIIPNGFPSSLVYVELDTECFDLHDILLFNDEIQDIIISSVTFAPHDYKINLRNKYSLRRLDLLSDEGVYVNWFTYPPTLQSLEIPVQEKHLKAITTIPMVEYLHFQINTEDDVRNELVRICDIIPSSVVEFGIGCDKYAIKRKFNMVYNKWNVFTTPQR